MDQETQTTQAMLAPMEAVRAILNVLIAWDAVITQRPNRGRDAIALVDEAFDILGNVRKRGGVTSGQLKTLECINAKVRALLS